MIVLNSAELAKRREEQEANDFACMSFIVWIVFVVMAEVLNEYGIFHVSVLPMRIASASIIICYSLACIVNYQCRKNYNPYCKGILTAIMVLCTFIMLTVLSFHVLIAVLFPVIISSYYSDRRLIIWTVASSVIYIPLSVVLSVVFKTYGVTYLAYLVYCFNPEMLSEETSAYMSMINSNISPIKGLMLYFVLPNTSFVIITGFMSLCVYKGRDTLHRNQIDEYKRIQRSVTMSLAELIEGRDDITGEHIKRTRDAMELFVSEIRLLDKEHDDSYWNAVIDAAPLHDLGKIAIDSSIIGKPGRLTDEEYEIIKTHSEKSGRFIEFVLRDTGDEEYIRIAKNIGRHHHEHWDGRGYPEGLSGTDIPYEARIMAYIDVFDALVSKRSYKEAFSFEKAFSIISEDCGKLFDPELFGAFEKAYPKIREYYMAESK